MDLVGPAKRVRVYVSEADHIGHQPAHLAVLAFLREEHAAGAVVLRAIESLSASGHLHTTRLVDVESKLPVVIEWVDQSHTVERVLPRLKALVPYGLITVEDTEVVLHAPAPVRELTGGLTAAEVMTADVSVVQPDTPARQVVELMLAKGHRAVPVVDSARRPVGIITNSDLVDRGGLGMRVELLATLDTPAVHAELERMASNHQSAEQIMTRDPVTVRTATPLPEVAETMVRRRLKRLPVVDASGTLRGIISRVDLLRTVGAPTTEGEATPPVAGLNGDTPLSQVMRRDVAAVHPETPLAEVLQAVISTRLNRAIVVGADRRVLGIVSDAELLERITPALHPSALRSLMHRLPFAHPDPATLQAEHHAAARTAAELMRTDVATARAGTPLREAIALMLRGSHKVIAVVDEDNRLLGIVDRADILHGLVAPS